MKINKELKHATFSYDEEEKVFTILQGDGLYTTVSLNKVYAFAFMRFVVRIAQRNWFRGKTTARKPQCESEEVAPDPEQMLIFDNNEELKVQ